MSSSYSGGRPSGSVAKMGSPNWDNDQANDSWRREVPSIAYFVSLLLLGTGWCVSISWLDGLMPSPEQTNQIHTSFQAFNHISAAQFSLYSYCSHQSTLTLSKVELAALIGRTTLEFDGSWFVFFVIPFEFVALIRIWVLPCLTGKHYLSGESHLDCAWSQLVMPRF